MAIQKRISAENSSHLPPQEFWLFTPGKDEPLPTPINQLGLVDTDALITVFKTTIDPAFTWQPKETNNIHHTYWERGRYPNLPHESVNPGEFRELWNNQIVIQEMAHNWMHLVTLQPPVPSTEVMKGSIDAYRTTRHLSRSAQLAVALVESESITEERRQRGIAYHLDQLETGLRAVQKISQEYHLIAAHDLNLSSTDELHALSACLKKAVNRSNRTLDIIGA